MHDPIVIPFRRHGASRTNLKDIRHTPVAKLPQALTRPGELWHVNAFDMAQLLVQREDYQERIIARFETARDCIAAAQARQITEAIAQLARTDLADFGRRVADILEENGR